MCFSLSSFHSHAVPPILTLSVAWKSGTMKPEQERTSTATATPKLLTTACVPSATKPHQLSGIRGLGTTPVPHPAAAENRVVHAVSRSTWAPSDSDGSAVERRGRPQRPGLHPPHQAVSPAGERIYGSSLRGRPVDWRRRRPLPRLRLHPHGRNPEAELPMAFL